MGEFGNVEKLGTSEERSPKHYVAKTKSGVWVFVDHPTTVHLNKQGWNFQEYPLGSKFAHMEPKLFVPIQGQIIDGTEPIAVEPVGESRNGNVGDAREGHSWSEQDYKMPDGMIKTLHIKTSEW